MPHRVSLDARTIGRSYFVMLVVEIDQRNNIQKIELK